MAQWYKTTSVNQMHGYRLETVLQTFSTCVVKYYYIIYTAFKWKNYNFSNCYIRVIAKLWYEIYTMQSNSLGLKHIQIKEEFCIGKTCSARMLQWDKNLKKWWNNHRGRGDYWGYVTFSENSDTYICSLKQHCRTRKD